MDLSEYRVRESVFEELVLEHRKGRHSHTVAEWDVVREETPTLDVLVQKAEEHSKVCDL